MKRNAILFLSILLLASSCGTISRTVTTKQMDIYGAGVIQHPVVAEFEVNKTKVTGEAQSRSHQTTSATRNQAVANAISNVNADILIEPVFESETRDGRTTIKVTGYPAVYTNFRPVTHDDIPLLEVGLVQKASVHESEETGAGGNTSRALLFLMALAGGVAILGTSL